MLTTSNIRLYLPEAAKAATGSPSWHTPAVMGRQFADTPALAKRCVR